MPIISFQYEKILNVLGVLCLVGLLSMTFIFQFFFNELPCPLCLLQRFGLLCAAFGYMSNLRNGFKPSNYAIALMSSLFTGLVALRQICLHIIPGTPAYGDEVMGYHFYTWSFILSIILIIFTTLILGINRQYFHKERSSMRFLSFLHGLYGIIISIILLNLVSVLFTCGLEYCPDNPTSYSLGFLHYANYVH